MTNTETRRRVAYHEAAHAVAAFRLGGALPRVTIIPTQDALGAVKPEELDEATDDRTYVVICLAGPAIDVERGIEKVRECAWTDFDTAAPFIARNGWSEEEILTEARAWVRSEMPAIAAVAEQLLIDDCLSDTEIAIVVGDIDGELEAPRELLLKLHRSGRDAD